MESKSNQTQQQAMMTSNDAEEEEETRLYGLCLAGGSILPMVVKTVIELGILDILAGADRPLSGAEIADKLPISSNPAAGVMVDRMMRLLACCSVVNCSGDVAGERRYGVNAVSKFLTRNNDGGVSFADLCMMNQDKVSMQSWYELKDAVLDGGVPFEKAYGTSVDEYRSDDKKFDKILKRAMWDPSATTVKKVLEAYKGFEFDEGVNELVVLGCGPAVVNAISCKYPSIKVVHFDLPHLDLDVKVAKGDAIYIEHELRNLSDEQCLNMLKRCYESLPENGKLVAVERLAPDAASASANHRAACLADVALLALGPGKERCEHEFKTIASAAGFEDFRIVGPAFHSHVMEFRKIKN